jgi:hypothetical protein
MKKLLLGMLLALVMVVPFRTMAAVNINIDIPLPPLIQFAAPPDVIVMPETDGVYAAPDLDTDLFFWDGSWWRLWEGRWYRSPYYDRDWVYYDQVPSFYFNVDPHWRTYYHNHNWYGHNWNYERIPYERLHQNWKSWKTRKSWGGQKNWGVKGYVPRTQPHTQELRRQRQEHYQQKPEVQQHQQWMREQQQQRQPQVERSQGQRERQPQIQQRERQQRQPERSQEKSGRGEQEQRK